jgi:hypothetical protein
MLLRNQNTDTTEHGRHHLEKLNPSYKFFESCKYFFNINSDDKKSFKKVICILKLIKLFIDYNWLIQLQSILFYFT